MSRVFTIAEGLENMGAIRSGGQGSVYKGRRVGEITTAVKLLPTPIFTQSEEDKHYRDFISEVKKLQRVTEDPNPNVVKLLSYGVSETGGFPYIEMEYIDGPDLSELLKEPHTPVFTINEVIVVAEQLSNALAHCHKLDVKHGDIKSNNVKFNQQTGNYVLLDFGLAMLSDEERRTSLRHAGAVEFMAPEQNEGKIFFETDVYSFGIILFELLAGRVPFPLDGNTETARNKVMVAHMEATPPDLLSLRASALPIDWDEEKKTLERHLPEWLLNLVTKCLQKAPADRFANGMELHDFICHHRMYTAEVVGIVENEDNKWKAVLAEKDQELEQLKAISASQLREIKTLRQRSLRSSDMEGDTEKKVVSRSFFNALLLLLLLVSGLAVYGLFFKHSTFQPAESNEAALPGSDTLATAANQNATVSENKSSAKSVAKAQRKKQAVDSTPTLKEAEQETAKTPAKNQDDTVKEVVAKRKVEPVEETNDSKKDSDENDNSSVVRYKVRNVAYFHNMPDASTRRAAFINHWNNAVLKPLDEKNGFIYIVYTNDEGQTSRGWLSKADLIAVK